MPLSCAGAHVSRTGDGDEPIPTNVYLHKFLRDDEDRALHDHPWVSLSIIFRCGYVEHTAKDVRRRQAAAVVFRRARHAHRIELLRQAGRLLPAWTLIIAGPKVREWGFPCPAGWRHWTEFVSEADSGNVGKGCQP